MTRLHTLAIRNFRNIERADLSFPQHGLALIGENGHGKTNLLEAIYYLQILRSMRGARDQDLVRFEAPAFFVEATIGGVSQSSSTHTIAAAFERQGKRKKVSCDGAAVTRLSAALGSLPSVVVSPRDNEIVTGAPSERRRFLDVLLSLTSRRYLTALQTYRTALANRNAALRNLNRRYPTRAANGSDNSTSEAFHSATSDIRETMDTVSVWEPVLAEYGAYLISARHTWVEDNSVAFTTLCAAIGERAPVRFSYTTTVAVNDDWTEPTLRERLLGALERKRSIDIRRGITHAGPHRDDLCITLGARDLKTFGSAGQQRTAAFTLRRLEAAALTAYHGTPPVLLLDDPFAELDTRRSAHILELLHETGIGQTILAVPRATDIPPELTTLERWTIHNGEISPATAEP